MRIPTENESETRFRLLVESVKDYAIFILDPRGYVTTWNPGAERINGYKAHEIIGKHFSTFYPADDVAAGKCDRELEIASREGRFEEDGWRVRKDGSRLWANVTISALRSTDGSLVGFAKVTRDLTERRAAEEQARRLQLLVESVRDYAIFVLDPTGHVETWNTGAERIKGYKAQEIIGKHFSVFYPPDVVATGKCELELQIADREGRFEEEGWRIRKDGSRMWASVTITAIRDSDGRLIGYAKVTRDLTERVAVEERLRALAAERAGLAEKARTQQFQERFVAILGHDLRNPLSSIDMGLAILQQRELDPGTIPVVSRMRKSTQRMSRMIEQILDLTRTRLADGLRVVPAPIELQTVIGIVVDELRAAFPKRAIDVHCPPLVGRWDQDRLEQVFSNLIGNAIEYGAPERPVTVTARAAGDDVQVEVHNHGPPIPQALQAMLFDPFRRGERESKSPSASGLGLGLYISSEIVQAHGGTIEVRSRPEEGTTFRITLPREAAR